MLLLFISMAARKRTVMSAEGGSQSAYDKAALIQTARLLSSCRVSIIRDLYIQNWHQGEMQGQGMGVTNVRV